MKDILRSHPNVIISTLAVLFVAIIIGFYSWTITGILGALHTASLPPSVGTVSGFDLTSAATLDLRGLLGGTSAPSVPIIASTPPSAFSTSTATATLP